MAISAVDTSSVCADNDPNYEDRVNLAAIFRMTARLNMDEAVGNHFSYAVSDDGYQFLMNPFGRHFSNIRASELLLLDAREEADMDQPDKTDPTAWAIHGAMHRNVPQARCVLHVHSRYATVLASIQQDGLPPIDQNSMRFLKTHAVFYFLPLISIVSLADQLSDSQYPQRANRSVSGSDCIKPVLWTFMAACLAL